MWKSWQLYNNWFWFKCDKFELTQALKLWPCISILSIIFICVLVKFLILLVMKISILLIHKIKFYLFYFHFQLSLMLSIHESIKEDRFPEFIKDFFQKIYTNGNYPTWVIESLSSVGVHLLHNNNEETENNKTI